MYWKNPDIRKYVSIVPTSGITGEGIPDIFAVLLKYT
jgi:translation initiation factor 5B